MELFSCVHFVITARDGTFTSDSPRRDACMQEFSVLLKFRLSDLTLKPGVVFRNSQAVVFVRAGPRHVRPQVPECLSCRSFASNCWQHAHVVTDDSIPKIAAVAMAVGPNS
jgi:hypothetical protein